MKTSLAVKAARGALGVAGVAILVYGLLGLPTQLGPAQLIGLLTWMAVAILIHDGVIVPLSTAAGAGLTRAGSKLQPRVRCRPARRPAHRRPGDPAGGDPAQGPVRGAIHHGPGGRLRREPSGVLGSHGAGLRCRHRCPGTPGPPVRDHQPLTGGWPGPLSTRGAFTKETCPRKKWDGTTAGPLTLGSGAPLWKLLRRAPVTPYCPA